MGKRAVFRYALPVMGAVFSLLIAALPLSAQTVYGLDDLYKVALDRAEKIKISEEDLFISEKQKDKAMSLLIPKISAFANYVRYTDQKISESGTVIQPLETPSWQIRLDQFMSLSGREFTGLNMAKEGIKKSRNEVYAVREGYLYALTTAYFDWLRIKKNLDIAGSNVSRLSAHRTAAATRLKIGEVTKTALLRAEAELSGAQSDFTRLSNALVMSKAVVARLAGVENPFQLKEIDPSDRAIDEILLSGLPETCRPLSLDCMLRLASTERAEIKALGVQQKIADHQVTYTKGAYWPTISVEAVYAKKFETPETSGIIKENIYGGFRIYFPLYEGGLRGAEVSEAMAKKRQADLSYADLKKSVGIEVENAYRDFMTQTEILQSLSDQERFARDNFFAVSKQFEYGLANSVDVMDANSLLVTAERQLADARYGYMLSILKAQRAMGILLANITRGKK